MKWIRVFSPAFIYRKLCSGRWRPLPTSLISRSMPQLSGMPRCPPSTVKQKNKTSMLNQVKIVVKAFFTFLYYFFYLAKLVLSLCAAVATGYTLIINKFSDWREQGWGQYISGMMIRSDPLIFGRRTRYSFHRIRNTKQRVYTIISSRIQIFFLAEPDPRKRISDPNPWYILGTY